MLRPLLKASLSAAVVVSTAVAATVLPASPVVAAASCPWVTSTAPIDQRVDQLLAQMTLDEKLQELHGDNSHSYSGTVPAQPRLCIPALTLNDGPGGVGLGMSGITQLPSPVSLASTFDKPLGKQYGQVIGSEEWAKGAAVALGPTVNIVRDPRWGRAFESYGEDPYLAGQIGVADVQGIQSTGELAQVKHWALYNQETNRGNSTDDVIIDSRTEQEIYLSQFKAIVEQAQPASLMCSYAFINGQAACQDPYIMNQVLREQWHYPGFVTTDWGGAKSTLGSVEAGLNMEMPDDARYGAALKQAVESGQVPLGTIDSLLRPTLTQMFRFNLFTKTPAGTPDAVVTTPANQAVGSQVAKDGTVLLKNADGILPLSPDKKSSIAVIGDAAGANAMTSGGGSAAVRADQIVTPYQGISARAGKDVTVNYAQGNSSLGGLPLVPKTVLTPSSGTGNGLTGTYYNGMTLSGAPLATRDTDQIAFDWKGGAPVPGVPRTQWSAKYTGTLNPPTSGTYTFSITSDDGSRLFVDGKQVIDNWHDQGGVTQTGQVTLTAGKPVSVEVDYYQDGGGSLVQFGWQPPGGTASPEQQAVDLARSSDVAVVFAAKNEAEGSDLSDLELPADETSLIEHVAAANPNTIVVLNTGSAVTMPWLDKVKGVFEAWYPGQDYGNAIAALLFGDVNPSGKLPVTFPKSLADVPASTPQQFPGVDGKVNYSEGLKVGYRWYDAQRIAPLFPFGSGLSYTSFRFGNLRVDPPQTTSLGTVHASVDVTNTGSRAGADVAQLYVGNPAESGEPPHQLKGFEKVFLQPGETKRVTFTVSPDSLATFDSTTQAWQVASGTYQLFAGDSSANLPLQGGLRVTRSFGPQGVTVQAPDIVTPGKPSQVTATFVNRADVAVTGATVSPAVPPGWTITPATATARRVGAHSSQSFAFTLTPPATAAPGHAKVTVNGVFTGPGVGRSTVNPASQNVSVPYAGFAAARNNVGISDNADPGAADFDGSGYSYSAQELAKLGITPGGTVTADGATFTWPDVPAGRPDNVATAGQLVTMTGSGTSLHLLGAGAPGNQSGDLTIRYTDGTTSTATVSFADWWSNTPLPADTLVATAQNWNQPPDGTGPHKVSLYATKVPLTPGKTIAYLLLPQLPGLHVFATATTG
ncbi:glycoside hydrolase family 3 C-terminal domain-containing protein [Amycolatopsis pithecellobii]|uniref:Exo-alpha-(1->6)-L-arabinopyranosidase n=1 Tax=Amycolatopsis pithecellobii TaxID=664692 RepID=A0A6N7Z3B3_9PSEU|nr:glycoside hydrolase family 3 C-terminal domain-containing protein [Amycolatopsis pithecellobii]MTD54494.1 beta-glucosidase [Amycolatopsis pithecellobii]